MSSVDAIILRETIVQLTAFCVGEEEYVVDILRIREIIRPLPITPIRKGPKYVKGVISLRGSVIPIIDLRHRFGLPETKSKRGRIMIMSIDGRVLGLIVDSVNEVVRVPRGDIRAARGILEGEQAPYFMGVVHWEGRMLILLNMRAIVGTDDDIAPPSAGELSEGIF